MSDMASQDNIDPALASSNGDMDIGTWLKDVRDEDIDPALRVYYSAKADTPLATTKNGNTIKPGSSAGPQNPPTALNPTSAPSPTNGNPWHASPFPPTSPGVSTPGEQITYLNFSRAIATSSGTFLASLFSSKPETIATVQLPLLTWQALTLYAWDILQAHCNRVRRVEQVLHDTCVALGGTYDPSRTIFEVNRVEGRWRDFVAKGVEGLGKQECIGAVVEMVDAAAGVRVDGEGIGGGGMRKARAGAGKLRKVDDIVRELW